MLPDHCRRQEEQVKVVLREQQPLPLEAVALLAREREKRAVLPPHQDACLAVLLDEDVPPCEAVEEQVLKGSLHQV